MKTLILVTALSLIAGAAMAADTPAAPAKPTVVKPVACAPAKPAGDAKAPAVDAKAPVVPPCVPVPAAPAKEPVVTPPVKK